MNKRTKFLVLSLVSVLLVGGIGFLTLNLVAQKTSLRISTQNTAIERMPELEDALKLQTVLRSIATNITPGVVSLEVEGSMNAGAMSRDPLFRFFFGEDERLHRQYSSMGSGFIITPDGYLFSNWHVVQNADKVKVTLADGRSFNATVIGADTELDIALLKIAGDNLPVVPLGDSDEVQVGDLTVAIGNPFGLSGTFTFGAVSALGREGMLPGLQRFIQSDVAVNPGNSGGPLLNIKGQAIGVNTAIRSQSGGYEGISFAIPINTVKDIAEQLFQNGSIERGFLGLVPQELDAVTRRSLGLDAKEGVLISSLEPKSPAEKAGLNQGDIITKVDNKNVETPAELTAVISAKAPKTTVELEIMRNGRRSKLIVTLGVRPNSIVRLPSEDGEAVPQAADTVNFMDVVFAEATPGELKRSGAESGVVVREISVGSKLSAVLSRGDIISSINNEAITSIEDMNTFAENNKNIRTFAFAVYKNGYLVYRSIEF